MKDFGVRTDGIATAQKPALVRLKSVSDEGGKSLVALEVTARPLAGDNSYLVSVFEGDASKSGDAKLLGSFSFFPPRLGEKQSFILPKPDQACAGQDLVITIRLIPANPAGDIKNAAVEIVGARLVSN